MPALLLGVWKIMKTIATCFLAAMSALAMAQSVTVTVHRVKQLDDLDKSTLFVTKDRADFYAQIWIDGQMWQSNNFSSDDGNPMWTFTAPVFSSNPTIVIKMMDDDGGFEDKDDWVDINPLANRKDLTLTLDRNSGRITGDLSGQRGTMLHSMGGHDRSQGAIWFTITNT